MASPKTATQLSEQDVRRCWPTVLAWVCAGSSVVLLLVLLAMALHVRVGLGHWPKPMAEDYQTFAFRAHEKVMMGIGLFAFYGAVPLWGCMLLFRRWRRGWRVAMAQALLFAAGWGLIYLAASLDPTTFTAWFLD